MYWFIVLIPWKRPDPVNPDLVYGPDIEFTIPSFHIWYSHLKSSKNYIDMHYFQYMENCELNYISNINKKMINSFRTSNVTKWEDFHYIPDTLEINPRSFHFDSDMDIQDDDNNPVSFDEYNRQMEALYNLARNYSKEIVDESKNTIDKRRRIDDYNEKMISNIEKIFKDISPTMNLNIVDSNHREKMKSFYTNEWSTVVRCDRYDQISNFKISNLVNQPEQTNRSDYSIKSLVTNGDNILLQSICADIKTKIESARDDLLEEQFQFYNYVMSKFRNQLEKNEPIVEEDLILVLLLGGPGVGKSYLIDKLTDDIKSCKANVLNLAATGIACVHINGQTIQGILPTNRPSLFDSKCQFFRDFFSLYSFINIDEMSMVPSSWIDLLQRALRQVNQQIIFGGKNVILSGDFFQVPPVLHPSIIKSIQSMAQVNKTTSMNDSERRGTDLIIQKFKIFQLKQNVRSKDAKQMVLLEKLRNLKDPHPLMSALPHIPMINNAMVKSNKSRFLEELKIGVSTNQQRTIYNKALFSEYCKFYNIPGFTWRLPISASSKQPVIGETNKSGTKNTKIPVSE